MLTILIVLVISQCNAQQDIHAECGSVKVNHPLLSGRVDGRRQQSLEPIRISVQYVTANISADVLSVLQSTDGPIRSVVTFFQSFLLVNQFNENLKAPPSCQNGAVSLSQCPTNELIPSMCGPHVQVPVNHTSAAIICNVDMSSCLPFGTDGTGVADSDYVLYVTSKQDDTCNQTSIVGYAGPCVYAENMDNQPYMGFINICPMALSQYSEEFVKVFVQHELTHALVFLDNLLNLFPNHPNPQTTSIVNGQPVKIITTPNVVAAARKQFDCPNTNGAMVENEGGPLRQGHWDSHLFFPELMNGILYQHLASYTIVSNITLSLFTDSGWYVVNYTAVDSQLLWGSGLGCEFVEEQCDNAYHCSSCCDKYIQCSDYDVRAFGYCMKPPLHDGCAIVMPGLFCSDNSDASLIANFIPENASVVGKLVFNVQSICTEAGKPTEPFNVNCVGRRCARIEGINLVALGIEVHGEGKQWCRRKDEFIFNGTVRCPAVEVACATATIETVDLTNDPVPPPLCHETCLTCQTPQDAATCTSCDANMKLNGEAPSTCVSSDERCVGNSYQSVAGVCNECPTGCSLCTGPRNNDCLACFNGSQFRDTTNKLDSPCTDSCPIDKGVMEEIDQFGRRLCVDLVQPTKKNSATSGTTGVAHVICLVTLLLMIIS